MTLPLGAISHRNGSSKIAAHQERTNSMYKYNVRLSLIWLSHPSGIAYYNGFLLNLLASSMQEGIVCLDAFLKGTSFGIYEAVTSPITTA